ncbi:phage tail sheath C-terminal domain-containing protein [Bradyrhizobium sp. Arg816]|uniref:phage tail sheath family protein n=1 Tax=Bradyrhizobium sp. Arg816 TaxID=2998491 RepID=UPI00249F7AE8|nr:phage tail sheath C-terminal domain-containing protein [Bradyrhizobium sp. Arg816]MDI3560153.1 phage tail sheath subtilisin-like domain-containing protein [Bradyrhizobium sp. Arg816]
MPVVPTYPGVYVQELPSGVRTITGVATSITAFVGSAARGPTDIPVVINSFGDFETTFGGLWLNSTLGFSVRDFFLNGGAQALVVRLYHADPGDPNANPAVPAPAAAAPLPVGELKFVASSPGIWGVRLRTRVDVDGVTDEVATLLGVTKADVFNLTVTDTSTGQSEKHLNLTVKDSPRRVDLVLSAESQLVAYDGKLDPATKIAVGTDPLGKLEDAIAAAVKALNDKQIADPSGDVTNEKKAVTDARKLRDDALKAALSAVSDGLALTVADFLPTKGLANKKGLYALEKADLFNLLCIPPYHLPVDTIDVDPNLVAAAATYCEQRRAMLLLDAPKPWINKDTARTQFTDADQDYVGTRSANAALFFPRLKLANPLRGNQIEISSAVGAIAGVFARTDTARGIWKAPAGLDATLTGVSQLSVPLTDPENGELNPLGVNCLRAFPVGGRVVWGARTLRGADQLADEYKYIPVRRTALYIEESLYRGLKWVVFEPNDEPLWAQIRLNVGAFMHDLFRKGAFQGASPRVAYFIKCDDETTTPNDINLGIVNVVVGFAPLKPAEFVIITIQQIAGQVEV